MVFNLKSQNIEYKLFYNPSSTITELIIITEDKPIILNQLYKIYSNEWNNYTISWDENIIKFYINAVEQASVKNTGLTLENFESIKDINYPSDKFNIDKLIVFSQYFDKKDVLNLLNIFNSKKPVSFTVNDFEREIWSLDNAQTRENSTRKEICLNGIWRFYPVLNNELTPEPRDEIYYSKVQEDG